MALLDGCRTALERLLRSTRRRSADVGVERRGSSRDPRALTCCMLALVALSGGLALVLSHAAPRRSGTNGVFGQAGLTVPAGMTACQGRELLPAGTSALRIEGLTSAPPTVVVRRGARVLDRVAATVDLRGKRIEARIDGPARDEAGVEVCIAMRAPGQFLRGATPPYGGAIRVGRPLVGNSLMIDYLMPRDRSWWALAHTVAARIDRGRGAWGGGWTAWSVLALIAASLLLTGGIVLRAIVADGSTPRLAAAVVAVAVVNAVAWSFVTPAFQVPDEVAHIAYVQSLGETASPPKHPPLLTISREQAMAMADARFGRVNAPTYRAAVWSPLEQRRLARDLRRPLSRRETILVAEAEPEPPLYYALEAIPYRAAHGQTLLDRLLLMRLLSALLAGVTALLSFLFVRECLPARPWAWAVGGLGVALMPMLGFMSGGINPDALLCAVAAALFLCVARAWRRGLTMRLALGSGALLAVGIATKVNFLGLVPGALLGLALAARRTASPRDRAAVRLVGAAVATAVALSAAHAAIELFAWHHPLLAHRPVAPESHVGIWDHISYMWQIFLPRLPFQTPTALDEAGYQQLFMTFVGAFGPLVVYFPVWVYRTAAIALALAGALTVRSLRARSRELRWRGPELLSYAAMAAGMMLLIALSADLRRNLIAIVQGRYLLPLLPLLGLVFALAARGAGERWGRAAGVAIVWSVAALSLFGQLLTIAFFYS